MRRRTISDERGVSDQPVPGRLVLVRVVPPTANQVVCRLRSIFIVQPVYHDLAEHDAAGIDWGVGEKDV